MKPITILLAATLTAGLAALGTGCARPAYVAKSDAGSAYLRGEVARIREIVYNAPEDRLAPPDTLDMVLDTYTTVDYNRAGNITRVEVFKGREMEPITREEYSYDPSGERMVQSVSRNLLKRTFSPIDYEYDEEGRLVRQGNRTFGVARTEYGYDRQGYLTTETVYSAKDSISLKVRFRYDRHGRLRGSKTVMGNGPKQKLSYHPNGVVARIRTGKTETDIYNEMGNLVAMTSIVTQRKMSKNRKLRVTGRYPVTLVAEYEHDPQGNWTKRTKRWEQEVYDVTVRKIEYYGKEGE